MPWSRSFDLSESSELHFGPSSPSLVPVLAPPPTISAHLGAGTTDFRRFSDGASTTVTIQSYRHTYKHRCCCSVAWDGAKDGGRGIGGREEGGVRWRSRPREQRSDEDEYSFQRQLVLTQHRLRPQHDSQKDFLSSLPSPIFHLPSSSNPGQLVWCGGQRGVGMAGGGQDGLTAFGASSSADLVPHSNHLENSCVRMNST